MIFQKFAEKNFQIDVFGAEKLEKNNGEKIFDLDRFILPESTFCYF